MDNLIQQYSRPATSGADMNSAISQRQLQLPKPVVGSAAQQPAVFPTGETLNGVNVVFEEGMFRVGTVYTQKYNVPMGMRAPQRQQPSNTGLSVEYNFK